MGNIILKLKYPHFNEGSLYVGSIAKKVTCLPIYLSGIFNQACVKQIVLQKQLHKLFVIFFPHWFTAYPNVSIYCKIINK